MKPEATAIGNISCVSKIQTGFTFLVPAHLGSPGKRTVRRVCVCVGDTLVPARVPYRVTFRCARVRRLETARGVVGAGAAAARRRRGRAAARRDGGAAEAGGRGEDARGGAESTSAAAARRRADRRQLGVRRRYHRSRAYPSLMSQINCILVIEPSR